MQNKAQNLTSPPLTFLIKRDLCDYEFQDKRKIKMHTGGNHVLKWISKGYVWSKLFHLLITRDKLT